MDSIDTNIDKLTQDSEYLDPKSQPAKTKLPFVKKTKSEIKALSPVEEIQYEIDLRKSETQEFKNKLRKINQDEGRGKRSLETRKAILWGKLILTQVKNCPDRKLAYMQLEGWMTQFLDNDRDRAVVGLPLVGESGKGENDDSNTNN